MTKVSLECLHVPTPIDSQGQSVKMQTAIDVIAECYKIS